jgi:hypothetical protein
MAELDPYRKFLKCSVLVLCRLDSPLKEAKLQQLSECLSAFVLVCVRLMRWPDDYDGMERDQQEDVRNYRHKLVRASAATLAH